MGCSLGVLRSRVGCSCGSWCHTAFRADAIASIAVDVAALVDRLIDSAETEERKVAPEA